MSDLAEFVLARIAEREAVARSEWDWMIERYGPDFWTAEDDAPAEREQQYSVDRDGTLHVLPRTVLARCAVDRQIVEEHAAVVPPTGEGKVYCRICVAPGGFGSWSSFRGSVPGVHFPCRTLRLLALPDASHPDYDESWKP